MRPNKLKAVAVACGNHAVPSRFGAAARKRSEDIVRLIALAGYNLKAERAEQLLERLKLRRQLMRHSLALRLIAVIQLVPEGGRAQIERDRHRIRFDLVEYTQQNA